MVLPLSYAEQIRRVPGVVRVAAQGLLGGLLPGRKEDVGDESGPNWTNAFANAAVDAEPYFAMNPELAVGLSPRMGSLSG